MLFGFRLRVLGVGCGSEGVGIGVRGHGIGLHFLTVVLGFGVGGCGRRARRLSEHRRGC